MKKLNMQQHWTSDEGKAAIAKALETEPEGPNKEYWTTDLTVDDIKAKYRTTKFKPRPLTVTLVRQCCGEKFVHVLKNKMKARSLKDWRCLDATCQLKTLVMPFGKFEGQTLPWIYEQEPSYLAWFHECVDDYEDIKSLIRGLEGIEAHLVAFRRKQRHQAIQRQPSHPQAPKQLTPTQQEVEWLMGKFTAQTVDSVCEELFGGEG